MLTFYTKYLILVGNWTAEVGSSIVEEVGSSAGFRTAVVGEEGNSPVLRIGSVVHTVAGYRRAVAAGYIARTVTLENVL
jgi:hypothetical protein